MSIKKNKTLLKELKNIEIESPDIDKGFSSDTIQEYVPFIDMIWIVGSNTIIGDKTIREYKELIEPNPAIIKVVEINKEENHSIYDTNSFYSVTKEFYEDNFSSSEPFFKWNRFRLKYKKQELFYNSFIEKTETFNSSIITVNPNKALGIRIYSDLPFITNITGLNNWILDTNKISPLSTNEIIISLQEQEQTLNFQYYGTEKIEGSDRIHPQGEDINFRDTFIHLNSTSLNLRMKPPGKSYFKDYFINTPHYQENEFNIYRNYTDFNLEPSYS